MTRQQRRNNEDRRIIEDMMGTLQREPGEVAVPEKKPTLKEAKEKLRGLNIVITHSQEYDEYRINFKGGKEKTAYYTNDLADAIGTGQAMATKRDWGDDPLGEWHGRNE